MTKNRCEKCGKGYKSPAGLTRHKSRMHPAPVPVPVPKRTTEEEKGSIDTRTLLGGVDLEVGDVVYIVQKGTISSITKTVGSRDVSVTLRISKSNWQQSRPL